MEELVEEMSIEEDLKDVKDTVENHGERIGRLETDSEVNKEKFNSITAQLNRIESNTLSSNNVLLSSNASMLQTMNKLVDSNTTKSSNRKEILMKILGIGGTAIVLLILGIFALKGANISIPTFLNLK